jgi:hypothetical protein
MGRQQIDRLIATRHLDQRQRQPIGLHQVDHLDQLLQAEIGSRRDSSFTKSKNAVSTCISQILSGPLTIAASIPVSRIQCSNNSCSGIRHVADKLFEAGLPSSGLRADRVEQVPGRPVGLFI